MYLCTQCDFEKLSDRGYDTREQAQNSEWGKTLFCRSCDTNCVHVPVR